MAQDESFIYIGSRAMEALMPGCTQMPDGSAISGLEVNIGNFYNKIAKLADPSDGIVAIMSDGQRYRLTECNERRTRVAAGDAVYDLGLKRMDVAKLFSDRMLEEYTRSERERPFGGPVIGLVADGSGIRERRRPRVNS